MAARPRVHRHARQAHLDRILFVLDEARYDAFLALLDAPPKPNAALRKLLAAEAQGMR